MKNVLQPGLFVKFTLIRAISNLPIEVINQVNIELPELKLVSDSTGMKSILFLNIEYGVTGKTLINQIRMQLRVRN